jgi:DNA-binding NarL/FixJ family response regulator
VALRLFLDGSRQTVYWAAIQALCRQTLPDLEDGPTPDAHDQFRPRLQDLESGRWVAFVQGSGAVTAAADAVVRGASAVLLVEDMTLTDFQSALDAVRGVEDFYIPQGLMTQMARGASAQVRALPANLTQRELEVLALIGRGHSNGEIAGRLHISVNTVRTHVRSLGAKLQVPGRAQLASTAWKLGVPGLEGDHASPPFSGHSRDKR